MRCAWPGCGGRAVAALSCGVVTTMLCAACLGHVTAVVCGVRVRELRRGGRRTERGA